MELSFTRAEAAQLRRISMTLRRWHELECGNDNGCIERDEATGKAMWRNSYSGRLSPIDDRETGAKKRLATILSRVNQHADWCATVAPLVPGRIAEHGPCNCAGSAKLSAYIQTDPRGAALYIIRPGDIPEGKDLDAYYSRGICVY